MKSVGPLAFYRELVADDDGSTVLPTASTAGPWSPDAQHGGPPSALLTRALERLPDAAGRVLGRVTVELWGPAPLRPLAVAARVVRPGRSVALAEASLSDVESGRTVATARGWLFPVSDDGPGPVGPPLAHGPGDGVHRPRPPGWSGGYVDAVEWRWVAGGLEQPTGAGVVWMRPPPLVEGEEMSPAQRLMACVDSASGVSSALTVDAWAFLNTELTVHLLRPPSGAWVCLDARTTLGPGAVGLATADVHDEHGLAARSAQALLVTRR